MTISDIAVTLRGEGMITKYTGGQERPSRDEIARLAYTSMRRAGGDMGTMWMTGYRRNGSSHITIARATEFHSRKARHGRGRSKVGKRGCQWNSSSRGSHKNDTRRQ